MFDPNLIKTIFDGVIGWDQNSDINGVQLESSLVSSSSGIKYNSFHPLLTFNNLYSIAPDYESIHGSLSPSTKALKYSTLRLYFFPASICISTLDTPLSLSRQLSMIFSLSIHTLIPSSTRAEKL